MCTQRSPHLDVRADPADQEQRPSVRAVARDVHA
jgi:hypothetical protein